MTPRISVVLSFLAFKHCFWLGFSTHFGGRIFSDLDCNILLTSGGGSQPPSAKVLSYLDVVG